MFLQISRNKKTVHRDIAARNVLMSRRLRAILCDFGLSRTIHDSLTRKAANDPTTTRYYYRKDDKHDYPEPYWQKAPETLEQNVSSPASDTWMFGRDYVL